MADTIDEDIEPDLRTRIRRFGARFKLDSHHAIERFGAVFAAIVVVGALVVGVSGVQAWRSHSAELGTRAVWTTTFTTSKTDQQGTVTGLYRNALGNRALILMHFSDDAKMSYNAEDYKAFLMGSANDLSTRPVETQGVKGSIEVFDSTGYIGLLLSADQPFKQQVLNVTMRAHSELTTAASGTAAEADSDQAAAIQAGDPSFKKYDQWRIFVNPAAAEAVHSPALDRTRFDPSKLYYETVVAPQERKARAALDKDLLTLRADLAQISSYTDSLVTTKVDGLFLRQPSVPAVVSGDRVTGHSAAEADHGEGGSSTLALETRTTAPGGVILDWRDGSVEKGYLDQVVPKGQSYVSWLQRLSDQGTDSDASTQISSMAWTLSNGASLSNDYATADVAMKPLVTLMNNLSQAYENYYSDKTDYQGRDTLALLDLDVALRDVAANSTAISGRSALVM